MLQLKQKRKYTVDIKNYKYANMHSKKDICSTLGNRLIVKRGGIYQANSNEKKYSVVVLI